MPRPPEIRDRRCTAISSSLSLAMATSRAAACWRLYTSPFLSLDSSTAFFFSLRFVFHRLSGLVHLFSYTHGLLCSSLLSFATLVYSFLLFLSLSFLSSNLLAPPLCSFLSLSFSAPPSLFWPSISVIFSSSAFSRAPPLLSSRALCL